MKTSLTETIRIERYLRGELAPENALVFEANLQLNPRLRKNVLFQNLVRRFVTLYHRRLLKSEVESVHEQLFCDEGRRDFAENIIKLFKA